MGDHLGAEPASVAGFPRVRVDDPLHDLASESPKLPKPLVGVEYPQRDSNPCRHLERVVTPHEQRPFSTLFGQKTLTNARFVIFLVERLFEFGSNARCQSAFTNAQ